MASQMRRYAQIKRLLVDMELEFREDNLTDPEPGFTLPEEPTLFKWANGGYIVSTTSGTANITPGDRVVPSTSGTYSTSMTWTFSKEDRESLKRRIEDGFRERMRKEKND